MTNKFTKESILELVDTPLDYGPEYAATQKVLILNSSNKDKKILNLIGSNNDSEYEASILMDLTFDLKKRYKISQTLTKISDTLQKCSDFLCIRNEQLISPLLTNIIDIYNENPSNVNYLSSIFLIVKYLLKDSANISYFPQSFGPFYFHLLTIDPSFVEFFSSLQNFLKYNNHSNENLFKNTKIITNSERILQNFGNDTEKIAIFLTIFPKTKVSEKIVIQLVEKFYFQVLIDIIQKQKEFSYSPSFLTIISQIFNNNWNNNHTQNLNILNFNTQNLNTQNLNGQNFNTQNLNTQNFNTQKNNHINYTHSINNNETHNKDERKELTQMEIKCLLACICNILVENNDFARYLNILSLKNCLNETKSPIAAFIASYQLENDAHHIFDVNSLKEYLKKWLSVENKTNIIHMIQKRLKDLEK